VSERLCLIDTSPPARIPRGRPAPSARLSPRTSSNAASSRGTSETRWRASTSPPLYSGRRRRSRRRRTRPNSGPAAKEQGTPSGRCAGLSRITGGQHAVAVLRPLHQRATYGGA